MTSAITLPATLPQTDWLPLPYAAICELRRHILAEINTRIDLVCELETALDAFAQFPDAESAGDALRCSALMAVRRHAA